MTLAHARESGRYRIWFLRGLKFAVTGGMLLLIAYGVDLSRTLQLLCGTNPTLLSAAFVVLAAQALLAVVRWRWVLRWQGLIFGFPRLVCFFWIGLFFNQILPSSVGGDAMRAYCLVRDDCGIGAASVAVLLDRICGLVGLILLVFVCQPLGFELISDGATRWAGVLVACSAAGGVCAVLVLDRLTGHFRHWRIARGMTALSRDARRLLFSIKPGAGLVALSVVVHLNSIMAMGVLALAVGVEAHWLAFVIIVPLASLLMTVPVSVAGWGVREGVMVVGLGYAGIQPEQAVALSVLYGLLLLAVALPGGVVWLADGCRGSSAKRSDAA